MPLHQSHGQTTVEGIARGRRINRSNLEGRHERAGGARRRHVRTLTPHFYDAVTGATPKKPLGDFRRCGRVQFLRRDSQKRTGFCLIGSKVGNLPLTVYLTPGDNSILIQTWRISPLEAEHEEAHCEGGRHWQVGSGVELEWRLRLNGSETIYGAQPGDARFTLSLTQFFGEMLKDSAEFQDCGFLAQVDHRQQAQRHKQEAKIAS